MPARDHFIAVLEESNNRYINFICGRARVYGAAYRTIATAIRNNHIQVIEDSRLPEYGMVYNYLHNTVRVNGSIDFAHPENKSLIIHEMTHAIEDFHRVPLSRADAEGAAYIAQMMYLAANSLSPSYEHNNGTFMFLQVVASNIATRILRSGRSTVTRREHRDLVRCLGDFTIEDRPVYRMLDTPEHYNGF